MGNRALAKGHGWVGPMFLFNKKKILALDVGAATIKIAELDFSRSHSTLLAFGVAPTPANSFAGGDILNPQAVADTIRALIAQIKTKRTHVATALSGTSVMVKKITIPRIDEKLIPEQIRWEAEQYIPYDINEVNLEYEILKSNTSPESMDLLLVAAIQGHVFKYAEAISLAGLNCTILDVSGFALANCFKTNYGEFEGQSVALLNLGATSTSMVVIDNKEVVFSRDIPVGGANFTVDLQKGLNVSQEEAEAIKLSIGKDKTAPAEAQDILNATSDVLTDEIKASFDFYLNSANAHTISRCFVTGGASRTVGLIERLSKVVPCEKLDPFFSVKTNPKSFSPSYIDQIRDLAAVVVGLGLRVPED